MTTNDTSHIPVPNDDRMTFPEPIMTSSSERAAEIAQEWATIWSEPEIAPLPLPLPALDDAAQPPEQPAPSAPKPPRLPVTARATDVLLLLHRIGLLSSPWISTLVFPDVVPGAMQATMARLSSEDLIWRRLAPVEVGRPKHQSVYGLTARGRAHLQTLHLIPGIPPKRRPPVTPPPSVYEIGLRLPVAQWCAALLSALRSSPSVESLDVTTEVEVAPDLRLDALVTVTFTPGSTTDRTPWHIPWQESAAPTPGRRTLYLAVIQDRGTVPHTILARMAETLRDYGASILRDHGAILRPILLTTTAERGRQIRESWDQGWPHGPLLLAPLTTTVYGTEGMTWDTSIQPDALPAPLPTQRDQWNQVIRRWIERSLAQHP